MVVLRKYQGLLTDYYGYVTNLLRLCYDITVSDTVKPRLHYGVNGTQPQHIRSLSGAFRGKP